MGESELIGKIRDVEKEKRFHLAQIAVCDSSLNIYRRALEEEIASNGDAPVSIDPSMPNLDGRSIRQAAQELLKWYAGHGKPEVEMQTLFDAMKPYRVVTNKHVRLLETRYPWRSLTMAVGGNNKKLFTIRRLSDSRLIQKTDLISLTNQNGNPP